ncbi:hypothetical protein J31TS3_18670 [Paenibacillus lactis]|nr:hypothetical protein J31TS3_18670 [Paenibacillus lactis]
MGHIVIIADPDDRRVGIVARDDRSIKPGIRVLEHGILVNGSLGYRVLERGILTGCIVQLRTGRPVKAIPLIA